MNKVRFLITIFCWGILGESLGNTSKPLIYNERQILPIHTNNTDLMFFKSFKNIFLYYNQILNKSNGTPDFFIKGKKETLKLSIGYIFFMKKYSSLLDIPRIFIYKLVSFISLYGESMIDKHLRYLL